MSDAVISNFIYSPQTPQHEDLPPPIWWSASTRHCVVIAAGLCTTLGTLSTLRWIQWPASSTSWRVQTWIAAASGLGTAAVSQHTLPLPASRPERPPVPPISAVPITPAATDQAKHKFESAMVLAGVGDALGYQAGRWEFDKTGRLIQSDIQAAGGIENLDLTGMPCSDDTVMTWILGMALLDDTIVQADVARISVHLAPLCADNYLFCLRDDQSGPIQRAYGGGTLSSLSHHAHALGTDAVYPTDLRAAYDEVVKPSSERRARLAKLAESQTTLPKRGAGCGAAMRSMPIGLAFSGQENREKLIMAAVESARVTHNTATGIYGSVVTALMTAFAQEGLPLTRWGKELNECRSSIFTALEAVNHPKYELAYALDQWQWFLEERGLDTWDKDANIELQDMVFVAPQAQRDRYTTRETLGQRTIALEGTNPDQLYRYWETFAYQPNNWPGASGHDAPLIAYDALLAAHYVMKDRDPTEPTYYNDLWKELCLRAAAHPGDSDSTMVIAGSIYGVLYGTRGVPENYLKAEPTLLQNMKHLGSELYDTYHTH